MYQVCVGPNWTEVDVVAVQAFVDTLASLVEF